MAKYYDIVSRLINIGVRTPFTYKEAIEAIGSHSKFRVQTPTPNEVMQALRNDSRTKVVGKRKGLKEYEFHLWD